MTETTYKITNEHSGIDIEVSVLDLGDGRLGGSIISNLVDDDSDEVQTSFDAVDSFILAAACAGIDVSAPAFQEAVGTTVQAIYDNVG